MQRNCESLASAIQALFITSNFRKNIYWRFGTHTVIASNTPFSIRINNRLFVWTTSYYDSQLYAPDRRHRLVTLNVLPNVDGQTLSGVNVDQGQRIQAATIEQLVQNEVHVPDINDGLRDRFR